MFMCCRASTIDVKYHKDAVLLIDSFNRCLPIVELILYARYWLGTKILKYAILFQKAINSLQMKDINM